MPIIENGYANQTFFLVDLIDASDKPGEVAVYDGNAVPDRKIDDDFVGFNAQTQNPLRLERNRLGSGPTKPVTPRILRTTYQVRHSSPFISKHSGKSLRSTLALLIVLDFGDHFGRTRHLADQFV